MTLPPILVTGTHRSGTTWVGDMLAAGPGAHYVHEPFAPMNERSWLREPPTTRYLHLDPDQPGRWAADLDAVCRLRPPWFRLVRRSPTPRHVVRVTQDTVRARRAARRGARAIIKDPFALLMAEWVERRTGADVVVLVRHPAAFVSSVKRLGWRLDLRWLLGQDELMATHLAPFRERFEQDAEHDLVDHGSLVWLALNTVVAGYEQDHPDWQVIAYEELALDPVAGFARMYERLRLPWDDAVAATIAAHNSPDHRAAVPTSDRGSTTRDSRQAIWTWRDRLLPSEVERVRHATWPLARRWYGDERWWPLAESSKGPQDADPR